MQDMIKIRLKENDNVVLKAIPGHFITPNSHVNYYLDMTTIKSRLSEASATAKRLARILLWIPLFVWMAVRSLAHILRKNLPKQVFFPLTSIRLFT